MTEDGSKIDEMLAALEHASDGLPKVPTASASTSSSGRNNELTRLGGTLARNGLTVHEIRVSVLERNAEFADPLPEDEIERTVMRSVEKWCSRLQDNRKANDIRSDRDGHLIADESSTEIPWLNAADFSRETFKRADYVCEPYFASGTTVQLAGPVKEAGKTHMLLHFCAQVLRGGSFMGYAVEKAGPVVYLTEEGRVTFQMALRRHNIDSRKFHFILNPLLPRSLAWEKKVEVARAKAREVGAGVLIIDTLSGIAGFEAEGENDSGASTRIMQPVLNAAAQDGLLVIYSRHTRKGGGSVGESARGSTAISGTADVLIQLVPATTEGHQNRRAVESIGRLDSLPPKLIIEWKGTGYEVLGSEADVEQQQAKALFMDFLPAMRDEAMTENDMKDHPELGRISRTTRRRVLNQWTESGTVSRDKGFGKKRTAFGYWLPDLTD